MESHSNKFSVLITGCSPGGMGEALAVIFHIAGHHVFATARDPSKLSSLAAQGIQTVTLDITSSSSIEAAVSEVSSYVPGGLNILINNAGSSYSMPISDISLDEGKKLFDTNVWGHIAVTQAFLPLIMKCTTSVTPGALPAHAMIVNHTSVGSLIAIPFQGVYNASKAAFAMFNDTMRMELEPFGIRVIELKTAAVRTNIVNNSNVNTRADKLPQGSIYEPAREVVGKAMAQEGMIDDGITPEKWATEVMGDILVSNPPNVVYRGKTATMARIGGMLPSWLFEPMIKKKLKFDIVDKIIKESRKGAK